jgi:hypothetical protein
VPIEQQHHADGVAYNRFIIHHQDAPRDDARFGHEIAGTVSAGAQFASINSILEICLASQRAGD